VTSEMLRAQCIKRDVDVTVTEFQYVFECECECVCVNETRHMK